MINENSGDIFKLKIESCKEKLIYLYCTVNPVTNEKNQFNFISQLYTKINNFKISK